MVVVPAKSLVVRSCSSRRHWLALRLAVLFGIAWSGLSLGSRMVLAEHPPAANELRPAGPVTGSLLIAGGGGIPVAVLDRYFELAGGEQARIVIITTASQLAGTPEAEQRYAHWHDRKPASLTFLHTRDRLTADRSEF